MTSPGMVNFLLARIAEDEVGSHDYWCSSSQVAGLACDCPRKRVLAEGEAKRRIVERESRWRRTKDSVIASSGPDWGGMVSVTWDEGGGRLREESVTTTEFTERFTEPSPPSEILRLLALPYADHPGYREEWKP